MKPVIFKRITPTTDVEKLAEAMAYSLHPDDYNEMQELGVEPFPYILHTLLSSQIAYAVYSQSHEVLNIMGLSAYHDYNGTPVWSLKAKEQKDYKREFIIFGRETIKDFLDIEPKLYNFISINNKSSLRFIKSCGAVFLDDVTYGARGKTFRPFILTKEAFHKCVAIR